MSTPYNEDIKDIKDIGKFLANGECFACGTPSVARCDRCMNAACTAHLVPRVEGGQYCAECVAIVTLMAKVMAPYILPDGNLDPSLRKQLKERMLAMMKGEEGPEMQRLLHQMASGPAVAEMAHMTRGTDILNKLAEDPNER